VHLLKASEASFVILRIVWEEGSALLLMTRIINGKGKWSQATAAQHVEGTVAGYSKKPCREFFRVS